MGGASKSHWLPTAVGLRPVSLGIGLQATLFAPLMAITLFMYAEGYPADHRPPCFHIVLLSTGFPVGRLSSALSSQNALAYAAKMGEAFAALLPAPQWY